MTTELWGKPFVDRGYSSQALFEKFFARGLHSVAPMCNFVLNGSGLFHDAMPYRDSWVITVVNGQRKYVPELCVPFAAV